MRNVLHDKLESMKKMRRDALERRFVYLLMGTLITVVTVAALKMPAMAVVQANETEVLPELALTDDAAKQAKTENSSENSIKNDVEQSTVKGTDGAGEPNLTDSQQPQGDTTSPESPETPKPDRTPNAGEPIENESANEDKPSSGTNKQESSNEPSQSDEPVEDKTQETAPEQEVPEANADEQANAPVEQAPAPAAANPQTQVDGGNIPNSTLTWKVMQDNLTGDRTLIVSGTGDMPDMGDNPPWNGYKNPKTEETSIDQIEVQDGVTSVSGKAFHNLRADRLILGKSITKIENSAFQANSFVSVTVPGNVKTVGNWAFAGDTSLEKITFEEGVQSIGDWVFQSGSDKAPLVVSIPASLKSIGQVGLDCKVSDFQCAKNSAFRYEDGALYQQNSDGTDTLVVYAERGKELDVFSIPETVTKISRHAFSTKTPIRKIIVPASVTSLPSSALAYHNPNLEEIVFNCDIRTNTQEWFSNDFNLKSVVFNGANNNLSFKSTFAGCSQLEKLTIPAGTTKLNVDSFVNCSSLTELKIEASNLTVEGTDILGNYDLIIGSKVNALNASFANLITSLTNLTFEPDNAFTIEAGALEGSPSPLSSLSGNAYVDSQGVLYLYDTQAGTAKVAYVPPSLKEVAIPAIIQVSDGSTYTVTSVGTDAFRRSNVESVTFEKPDAITSIEAYGFANCPTLSEVNGETTLEAAQKSFPNANIGRSAFWNTGLTGSPGQGSFSEHMNGSKDLTAKAEGMDDLRIAVSSSGQTLEWQQSEDNEKLGGYKLLTGDTLTINATFEGKQHAEGKCYRVYVRLDSDDGALSIEPGSTYTLDGVEAKCFATNDPYTVYLEFSPTDKGTTATIPITVDYPSPNTAGGGVTIWGVAGVEPTGEDVTEGDIVGPANGDSTQTIQAYWTTQPDTFTLTKTGTTESVDLTGSGHDIQGDASRPAKPLVWNITVQRDTNRSSSYGKDYARSMTFTDTFTLPTGAGLNNLFSTAIRDNTLRRAISNGEVTLSIAGTVDDEPVKMLSIKNRLNATPPSGVKLELVSDGSGKEKLQVTWTYFNTLSQGEIAPPSYEITLHPDALTIDTDEFAKEENKNRSVTNSAETVINYTYSESKRSNGSASIELNNIKGSIELVKSKPSATYMGEDAPYTITVRNPGSGAYYPSDWPLEQPPSDPKPYTVTDTLSSGLLITPEGMEQMYDDVSPRGLDKRLTITINNAIIDSSVRKDVTDARPDGGTAHRTPANSETKDSGNHTVTVTMEETGIYRVSVDGGNAVKGTDLNTLLEQVGYAPNASTSFTCAWELDTADPTTPFFLYGGEEIELSVHATAKSTFELIQTDWPYEYPEDHPVTVTSSTTTLADWKGVQLDSEGGTNLSLKREAQIDKKVSREGVNLSDKPTFQDTDVLDYTVGFNHYGTGSYTDLPLVDDMYGSQYLMVPADKNPGLASHEPVLKTVTKNSMEYYLLSPGTYNNVVVGTTADGEPYTAALIEVTKADSQQDVNTGTGDNQETNSYTGLHTHIEWFHSKLPSEAYRIELTYQAYVDASITGESDSAFDIGNVAWANNKPNDRLYTSLWGGGTIIDFQKRVVTDIHDQENPADDDLADPKISTQVGQGDSVTYQLKLFNNTGGTARITGADISDALPNNFNAFSWEKDVNVTLSSISTSDATQIVGLDQWSISGSNGGVQIPSAGQQFIVWPESMGIDFAPHSAVYLYVTLTFPANNPDGKPTWSNYTAAAQGTTLKNTLWVHRFSDTVLHELEESGEAMLQKGVYALSSGTKNVPEQGGISDSRDVYNSKSQQNRYVTYYALLLNTGNTRLYLNDLYDKMPEGFSFAFLRETGKSSGTGKGNYTELPITTRGGNNVPETFDSAPFVDLEYLNNSGNTDDIVFRSAQVSVDTTMPTGQMRFMFGAGDGQYTVKYDETRGLYYLDRNEAIVFGYTLEVGTYSETEETATNALAMPYEDYLGTGLVVSGSDDSRVKVHASGAAVDKVLGTNDGDASSASSQEIKNKWGLAETDGAGHEDWLVSDVALRRGKAIVGVSKRVKSYTGSGNTDEHEYVNSVGYYDTLNWEATLRNDGEADVQDYTIVETMPHPYTFTGDVSIKVTPAQGGKPNEATLFSVEKHTPDETKVTFEKSGKTYEATVGDGTQDWTPLGDKNVHVFVKLTRLTNKSEQLEIKLNNTAIGDNGLGFILQAKGGNATLGFHSSNESGNHENTVYTNRIQFLPEGDLQGIDEGNRVENEKGDLIGVSNSAPFNVAMGLSTISYKQVTEIAEGTEGGSNNSASSAGSRNTIQLADADNAFRYTLSVKNAADKNISKLVLLDNLPQPGDTNPYGDNGDRGSAFTVRFAEDPAVNVIVTRDDGAAGTVEQVNCTIQYSSKTTFEEGDRSGTINDGWTEAPDDDSRSIRIVITSPIPNNATVTASFNAKVDGDAEPASVAWNSFGYRYTPQDDKKVEYSAMPGPVGVRVPSAPELVKRVVDSKGNPFRLPSDTKFTFLVFEGEVPAGTYASPAEVIEAFKGAGKTGDKYEVTVPKGKSESPAVKLKPSNGVHWQDDQKYTVVEMLSGDDYEFKSMDDNDDALYHTFTYNHAATERITCENTYAVWNLNVLKVDGDSQEQQTPLPDAVFALYSPNETDKQDIPAEFKDLDINSTLELGPTNRTYYLCAVDKTDKDGKLPFQDLHRDRYYLLEVKAPDGYNLPDNPGQLVQRTDAAQGALELPVKNYPGPVLPSTGGTGNGLPQTAGALTALAALVYLARTRMRRREDGA